MKRAAFTDLCALGLAGLFTACGGGGSSHSASPAQPAKDYVYVLCQHNKGVNQIQGYSLDHASGMLTPLAGMPMPTEGIGDGYSLTQSLAYDPVHQRLYAVNDGSDTVSGFAVDRDTGALAPCPFNPIALGTGVWTCLAVHPSGSPLVAFNQNEAWSFRIDGTSATPSSGTPYATHGASLSCAFTSDGSRLFASGGTTGVNLNGFSVNAATGDLSPLSGSPYQTGLTTPAGCAVDRTGRLFMTALNSGNLRVVGFPGGAYTKFYAGTSTLWSGVHALLHPAGYYLVADHTHDQVGVFKVAGSEAATTLTPATGSPFPTGGTSTQHLALSADGKLLVVAHTKSRNLAVFSMDPGTGALHRLSLQPADTLEASAIVTGVVCVPAR